MTTVKDLCMSYTIGDMINFYSALDFYDCIIVEGYECVGKSYFIDILKKEGYPTYRPSYEKGMDNIIERSQRALPGIIAVDAHIQNTLRTKPLILDRGLPSGLVYGQLLQGKTYRDYTDMVNLFKNTCGKVLVIYKYHSTREDAKIIHESAIKSREALDIYDTKEFEEYYNKYLSFEDKFMEVFKFLGCDVLGINSLNTSSLPLLAERW